GAALRAHPAAVDVGLAAVLDPVGARRHGADPSAAHPALAIGADQAALPEDALRAARAAAVDVGLGAVLDAVHAGTRVRAAEIVVDLAVAVVVDPVAHVDRGQHLADARPPGAVALAGLGAGLAGPHPERHRRAAVAGLHFSRRAGAAVVHDPVAVVVASVAHL